MHEGYHSHINLLQFFNNSKTANINFNINIFIFPVIFDNSCLEKLIKNTLLDYTIAYTICIIIIIIIVINQRLFQIE